MKKRNRVDGLLQELSSWELRELRALQAALGGLIEALDTDAVVEDVRDEPVKAVVKERDRPAPKPRGHIEEKYIPRGKKLHGPYRYRRYWEGGRLRSKYLGKVKSSGYQPSFRDMMTVSRHCS